MPPKRKYASLEERYTERNRHRREQYAASKAKKEPESSLGICTVALTALNESQHLHETQPSSTTSRRQFSMRANFLASNDSFDQNSYEPSASAMNENLAVVKDHVSSSAMNENLPSIADQIAPMPTNTNTTGLNVQNLLFQGCPQQFSRNEADPLSSIATEPVNLPDVSDCRYCKAKRFLQEPPSFCCLSGEIHLVPLEMPRELMLLYLEDSDEAAEFRRCVKSYNNMFAFNSIGMHCDNSLAENYHGIYTFRIQGQMMYYVLLD